MPMMAPSEGDESSVSLGGSGLTVGESVGERVGDVV